MEERNERMEEGLERLKSAILEGDIKNPSIEIDVMLLNSLLPGSDAVKIAGAGLVAFKEEIRPFLNEEGRRVFRWNIVYKREKVINIFSEKKEGEKEIFVYFSMDVPDDASNFIEFLERYTEMEFMDVDHYYRDSGLRLPGVQTVIPAAAPYKFNIDSGCIDRIIKRVGDLLEKEN